MATVATAILAGVIPALILIFLHELRETEARFTLERERWEGERHELLNRIQRPEVIPVSVPEVWASPDGEPDEYALIGTIQDPPEAEE